MSEAEPIPPTSSVTALRIPMIKKDQATTDPASSSAPKTSLAANARRNNEKALNILLSAIPDRHLLSFHDATNAKTLWTAIKARFGGNDASKKMQKNLLSKRRKHTSLAQERNQMMSFLKGQGYKNLQKLKYPQMKELYDKVQASIKDSFKDFIPMDSEKEREMLKEREAKRLLRKRKATISEEQPSKKPKLRTETIDELRNYLRVVDFEKNAQDRESLEGISMITELQVIDSPDGEYLIIHRENNHFRAFDTLWEILHVLDRQDLYHLYRVVDDYYEHIPPTGLGLMLLGDLTIIWETAESSDDDFWKDQEEWEIIRWRFHESSGVHTLEIEDGTMIHMLAERRYPLSRELMIRMLDHGMEVEDETETAITLIHLFIFYHIAPIPPGIVEADFDPDDDTSSDDDDFEDIEYISLEEVEQEEKEFDLEDIFQVQDVILREKLLNVHRLISNIKSLKVNSTPDRVLESPSPFPIPVVDSDAFFEESDTSFSHLDNSLPEFETFSDHSEETRSGNTTTHANYSLPEYESFYFDNPSIPRPPPEPPDIEKCFEPKAGILIIKEFKGVSKSHDFMTSILPTLVSDLPFISSIVSFENEDTIFDPGIVTIQWQFQ
ncbi:hypothetical protein Tco_1128879 [Tanacetum coccineum]